MYAWWKNKMAVRKKDGGPDLKYFESPETAALFEPVKQFLLKNHKKVILGLFVISLVIVKTILFQIL